MIDPKSALFVSGSELDYSDDLQSGGFKVKNPKGGEDITLSDDRILDITVAGKPGELGFPFEITLPLEREVAVK